MIDFNEGRTIAIDKPLTWTSFQVVKKLRYLTKAKKVGHAGTLDPLATGLLIICTGKHTKQIAEHQGQMKEYTGTFKLGAITPSYDLETEETDHKPIDHITTEAIEQAKKVFIGEIQQKPPIFSAVKLKGERAYEKARRGEEVEIKAKTVLVEEFELTRVELPEVDFRIRCGKGTYIRSLARDLGKELGCGAHLTALRRTKIGEISVDDAHTVEQFEAMIKALKQA
ncbi:MAG: tRNA pseudouridine(55) synthase TruB [Bacteroidia bacterium]|nr:tRNA pseudouridine(55) synthase TruB [Bacteroidia bacterium]